MSDQSEQPNPPASQPPLGNRQPPPVVKGRRWSVGSNVAAVVAVVLLAVFAVVAIRNANRQDQDLARRLGAENAVEPAHQVVYDVTAAGTANEDVKVQYAEGDGSQGEASLPGIAPVWAQTVTTEPGMYGANVSAYGYSSDFAFTLFCRITVDGVEVTKSQGTGNCNAQFDFSNLAKVKAGAAASPTPTVAPTTPRPQPTTPAACEWVDAGEMTRIVSQAAGVTKLVLGSSGDKSECHQLIDRDTSAVTYKIEKKGRRGGFPGVRVKGIKEEAWWFDYGGQMGELRVTLPSRNVFVVSIYFLGLRADTKQIAVATYKAARSSVLKK